MSGLSDAQVQKLCSDWLNEMVSIQGTDKTCARRTMLEIQFSVPDDQFTAAQKTLLSLWEALAAGRTSFTITAAAGKEDLLAGLPTDPKKAFFDIFVDEPSKYPETLGLLAGNLFFDRYDLPTLKGRLTALGPDITDSNKGVITSDIGRMTGMSFLAFRSKCQQAISAKAAPAAMPRPAARAPAAAASPAVQPDRNIGIVDGKIFIPLGHTTDLFQAAADRNNLLAGKDTQSMKPNDILKEKLIAAIKRYLEGASLELKQKREDTWKLDRVISNLTTRSLQFNKESNGYSLILFDEQLRGFVNEVLSLHEQRLKQIPAAGLSQPTGAPAARAPAAVPLAARSAADAPRAAAANTEGPRVWIEDGWMKINTAAAQSLARINVNQGGERKSLAYNCFAALLAINTQGEFNSFTKKTELANRGPEKGGFRFFVADLDHEKLKQFLHAVNAAVQAEMALGAHATARPSAAPAAHAAVPPVPPRPAPAAVTSKGSHGPLKEPEIRQDEVNGIVHLSKAALDLMGGMQAIHDLLNTAFPGQVLALGKSVTDSGNDPLVQIEPGLKSGGITIRALITDGERYDNEDDHQGYKALQARGRLIFDKVNQLLLLAQAQYHVGSAHHSHPLHGDPATTRMPGSAAASRGVPPRPEFNPFL